MNTLLQAIIATAGRHTKVIIGRYQLWASEEGDMTVRQMGTGLMGPIEKHSIAGLRRILDWMDAEEE